MAINNFFGCEEEALELRLKTREILASPLSDSLGLIDDLTAVGYFRPGITGGVAAMLIGLDDESELFVNDLPTIETVQSHGIEFSYESLHRYLLSFKGRIDYRIGNRPLLSADKTGFVFEIETSELQGKFLSPKCIVDDLAEIPKHEEAMAEAGLAGAVGVDDIVDTDRYQWGELISPTQIYRVASKWKSYTFENGAFNPETYTNTRPLDIQEARRGLQLALEDLQNRRPRRDIDIVGVIAPDIIDGYK